VTASAAGRLSPEWWTRYWHQAHPEDRKWLADIVAPMPRALQPHLLKEWNERRQREGRWAGNLYALHLRDELLPEFKDATGLPFDATEDEIAEAALRIVANLRRRIGAAAGEPDVQGILGRYARRHRVEMPGAATLSGRLVRMLDAAWWRRALRKRFRTVEHAQIKAGCVHKSAGLYVSNEAFRRAEQHAKRLRTLLESLEVVNEDTGEILSDEQTGTPYTLLDLHDSSVANPAIRFAAMMTCVRGLEARAKALGFEARFIVVTCPSRMHARHWFSGEANSKYDGTAPRDAQKYLARNVWNSAVRAIAHRGLKPGRDFFGLRTVEPNHDATPHWNVLAFVRADRADLFADTLTEYARADSRDEPGADLRRVRVQVIDPTKGSAAGYVVKYIAKGLHGEGVGKESVTGQPATATAARVCVWKQVHGIRQFQFFGVGSVSPFRELYRLDGVPEPLEALLGDLYRAARAGDFAAFIAAREARKATLRGLYIEGESKRYPGEQTRRLRGVAVQTDAGPVPVITRPETYSVRRRDSHHEKHVKQPFFAVPWTRFNNSATPDLTGIFGENGSVKRVRQVRDGDAAGESGKDRGVKHPGRSPLTGPGHSQDERLE
jgi:hypothetical protein